MQATLFDTADQPAADAPVARAGEPFVPAEPWLVEELVRDWGVNPETAAGYSLRQAFAVRARLSQARALADGGKPSKAPELPAPAAEPHALPPRPGRLVREIGAVELAATLADFEAGAATEDELYRFIRGTLYLLSAAELVRVGKGLIALLRSDE